MKKFECIKGMATKDNTSVVVMQGDIVKLISITHEGIVFKSGNPLIAEKVVPGFTVIIVFIIDFDIDFDDIVLYLI